MNLAAPIVDLLQHWNSSSEYDGVTIESFLTDVTAELVKGNSSEMTSMKGAFLTLFVEAARHSLDPENLLKYCEENLLITNKETRDIIAACYAKLAKRINFYLLQTTSTTLPHIVGISVKHLYESSTTETGRSGQLLYLVNLELQHSVKDTPKSFEMICRNHELQDLLSKLSDALKSIKKFGS